jgi:endonuclease/exonuclease/phosphatase family metal-dependent hydrolase
LVAGALLVVLAALLNETSGATAAVVFVVAHAPAAALLSEALGRPGRPGPWRAGVGMGLASLGFLLPTLLFYLHYEIPLPFPNVVLAPIAAALLAAAGLRGAPLTHRPPRWPALIPAALLIVPVITAVASPAPEPSVTGTRTFRLVDYNVHTTVDVGGQLDPEAIAQVIAGQHPDVVVLQEVSRGWAVAGSIDAAEWLARRLGMPYVYSEAADKGFGNAVLSRIPILDADVGFLPQGSGPMDRSWVRAVLDLGAGDTVTVIGTHLHHRHEVAGDEATRLQQIGALLSVWGGRPETVIAGDMNATPGSEEIGRFRTAGFRTAGDVPIPTSPSTDPRARIDYIFGTPDLSFSEVTIPASTASDHLAVAATVSVG